MITLVRAGAEDLETIIAIQRASFKAVYEKYHDEYDPYLEDRERIKWKLAERPNSYYYFVKKDEAADTHGIHAEAGILRFDDFIDNFVHGINLLRRCNRRHPQGLRRASLYGYHISS